jgi:hypothetical protein
MMQGHSISYALAISTEQIAVQLIANGRIEVDLAKI